jgi:transposase
MLRNEEVQKSIGMHIPWLEKAIQQKIDKDPKLKSQDELLQSIPDIGEKTSVTVLAYVAFERFKSAKEISAFIGVNPGQRISGTSIRGHTRLSKTGNAYLRKSLYMPALSALRFNNTVKSFAKKLTNNGKKKWLSSAQ